MKKTLCFVFVILFCFCTVKCDQSNIQDIRPVFKEIDVKDNEKNKPTDNNINTDNSEEKSEPVYLKAMIIDKYSKAVPHLWGENIAGVITRIDTDKKIIALTFDACGGKGGSGYDKKLIDYLTVQKVPATLFINSRWIDENYDTFIALSNNPLFEIENHGSQHKPLSVNGKTAYGIQGTANPGEVVDEVLPNAKKLERLTKRAPKYFRSGTDYYDEYSVKIVQELNEKPISYTVLGDAGATYSKDQIKKVCLKARQGSIIIFHMNHPEKATAQGIMEVIPAMKKQGFEFVKLEDYDNYLR